MLVFPMNVSALPVPTRPSLRRNEYSRTALHVLVLMDADPHSHVLYHHYSSYMNFLLILFPAWLVGVSTLRFDDANHQHLHLPFSVVLAAEVVVPVLSRVLPSFPVRSVIAIPMPLVQHRHLLVSYLF